MVKADNVVIAQDCAIDKADSKNTTVKVVVQIAGAR
jgi:hypothetical protein